mgnify:CR=1 FL=1
MSLQNRRLRILRNTGRRVIFDAREPGTVPLKLYWNGKRTDNFSTVTAEGERAARAGGYQFVRIQGYVYPNARPGTIPLKLYWNANRRDNFSTATAAGERAAKAGGYRFVRIQGYVLPLK